MNDVERGEVAEGRCGENTVAVVQRVDIQDTQVQQLQHTRQKVSMTRSLEEEEIKGDGLCRYEGTCVIWMYVSWENCGTRKFSPSFWAST